MLFLIMVRREKDPDFAEPDLDRESGVFRPKMEKFLLNKSSTEGL
jgi:hypothetical protein